MNNFGARSADYKSFQFSDFSFQKYEKSERIVGRGTPCHPGQARSKRLTVYASLDE